jgi:hypothetical protein
MLPQLTLPEDEARPEICQKRMSGTGRTERKICQKCMTGTGGIR